jgi:hypothetical protein
MRKSDPIVQVHSGLHERLRMQPRFSASLSFGPWRTDWAAPARVVVRRAKTGRRPGFEGQAV